jgi:hypothetical protein
LKAWESTAVVNLSNGHPEDTAVQNRTGL